jgi:hypothetical protein
MVACRADYASLGSGARPALELGTRTLLDELDVADLESEAAHGYVLGPASAQDNLVQGREGRVDGGRGRRSHDTFRLALEAGGLWVVRFSAEAPSRATLSVAGQVAAVIDLVAGDFQELALPLPPGAASGVHGVAFASDQPLTVLHYWSFGRVL